MSKGRRSSRSRSHARARRSLRGAIGARNAGSVMTSRPAAAAWSSSTGSPLPVISVISKRSGSMLSAPRSACCPAPPSSRVMTVATFLAATGFLASSAGRDAHPSLRSGARNPAARATRTASRRLCTSSLAKMFRVCVRTVSVEISRSWAI